MEEQNKLAVIVNESGIEQTKAQYVLSQFQAFAEQAAEWEQKTRELVITDASQVAEMKIAKSARLNLRDIRVAADKKKKELKSGLLVEGRLIDALYNFIAGITEPLEAELKAKEEFAERQEAARLAELKSEREEQLKPYGVDTQFYNLSAMSEQAFSNLLDMTRTAHEAKLAAAQKEEEERIAREKKEAEEKAERERLDREERAKQAAENARLKAEAEERERQIAAERAKAEAERKAIEEKARKEAEERASEELKRLYEEKKAREKADAEIHKANEAAENARRELQAKKDAEEKAKKDESDRIEAERKRLESAGDKEKLVNYLHQLQSVSAPNVNGENAKRQLMIVRICIDKAIEFSEKIK